MTPFRWSMGGIGLNAVFDWLLVGAPTPWGQQLPGFNFGAPGLVLATVLVNVITCLGLLLALQARLGALPLRVWFRDTALLALAAVVGALLGWLLAHGVAWPAGLVGLLLQNALSGALALGLYGLLATLFRVPEAAQLLQLVRRKPAS